MRVLKCVFTAPLITLEQEAQRRWDFHSEEMRKEGKQNHTQKKIQFLAPLFFPQQSMDAPTGGELGFEDFNVDFYMKKLKKIIKKKRKVKKKKIIITKLGQGSSWENAFVTVGTALEAAGPGAPCGREDGSMTAVLGSPGAHWRHVLLSLLWKPCHFNSFVLVFFL